MVFMGQTHIAAEADYDINKGVIQTAIGDKLPMILSEGQDILKSAIVALIFSE